MKEKNFSHTSRPMNIEAVYFFKTSGTNYPVTWHDIPEEWNIQPHHHENLKTVTQIPVFLLLSKLF
jgi:hypothetical protein